MERVCSVKFNGIASRFIVSNANDVIQRNFLEGNFFEEDELCKILEIAPKGICLDIGANVGNHTVFFARHCGFSEVIPFEPNPVAAEMFRRNVQLNELRNVNLQYVGIALGGAFARAALILPRRPRHCQRMPRHGRRIGSAPDPFTCATGRFTRANKKDSQ